MPLNYNERIPNSLVRLSDDFRFTLAEPVSEWVADECVGTSIFRFEDDEFVLSFADQTDATLFALRFRA